MIDTMAAMRKDTTSLLFAIITVLFFVSAADVNEKYGLPECIAWGNVSRALDAEKNVDIDCKTNAECSGIDCIGKYHYSGIFAMGDDFLLDFCFGMVLEACSKPTALQMYLEILHNGTEADTTIFTITNDTMQNIKGASFDMFGSKATGALVIKMNHVTIHNKSHIDLSVVMEVRVHSSFLGFEIDQPLENMEVEIVKELTIPVPPCNPLVSNHTHIPGTCSFSAVQKLPTHQHLGPGKDCQVDSMQECGQNEICDNNKCYCLPNHEYNPTSKKCLHQIPPNIDIIEPPPDQPSAKRKSKNVIVIVSSVVGVLVLTAFIAVGVMIGKKYRNYRQRYGQHQLVLSEDDDPEVERLADD